MATWRNPVIAVGDEGPRGRGGDDAASAQVAAVAVTSDALRQVLVYADVPHRR